MSDEVAEGFDHLEQEEVDRLRAKKKQIYEDLKDAVDREWVGLSEDELEKICDGEKILFGGRATNFIRSIEAKLKEKNT